MSLEDNIRELNRQVSELSRRTADIPVRWASGGSGSGSGDDTTLQFGVATSDISAATDDPTADWGDGMFKPIDWDGVVATDEIAIKNRFRGTVDSGVHFWWMNSPTGDPILVVPDCL